MDGVHNKKKRKHPPPLGQPAPGPLRHSPHIRKISAVPGAAHIPIIMLVPVASTTLPVLPLPQVHLPVAATSQLIAADRSMQSMPNAMQALSSVDSSVKLALGGILMIIFFGAGINAWRQGATARARAGGIPPTALPLLFLCIAIDIVSDTSYMAATPRVGFFQDLVWGPVSALALAQAFGSKPIALAQLVKELISLDFLPVATIAWLFRWGFPDSPVSKDLGIASKDQDISRNATKRDDK